MTIVFPASVWHGGPMSLLDARGGRTGRRSNGTEHSLAADPTSAGAIVELDAVTMRFGQHTVTEPISLRIGAGEVVCIVGPSGCGKTTLLRAIAGLMRPSNGSVQIDGHDAANAPDGVAMVFQHFGLFPWKSVQANVAYPLRLRGVPKQAASQRAGELIALMGLGGFEHSYPHQLSGGMQQRTGLARALAADPRVLLMDEPFGALDAQTREVLQFELLRTWREQPVTTVFVTHSIDEAVLFGDRVVVLNGCPSAVVEVIDVKLPNRHDRDVLRSAQFIDLREHVWSLVMADAHGAQARGVRDHPVGA